MQDKQVFKPLYHVFNPFFSILSINLLVNYTGEDALSKPWVIRSYSAWPCGNSKAIGSAVDWT